MASERQERRQLSIGDSEPTFTNPRPSFTVESGWKSVSHVHEHSLTPIQPSSPTPSPSHPPYRDGSSLRSGSRRSRFKFKRKVPVRKFVGEFPIPSRYIGRNNVWPTLEKVLTAVLSRAGLLSPIPRWMTGVAAEG